MYILRKTDSLKIVVKNTMTVLTAHDFDMSSYTWLNSTELNHYVFKMWHLLQMDKSVQIKIWLKC